MATQLFIVPSALLRSIIDRLPLAVQCFCDFFAGFPPFALGRIYPTLTRSLIPKPRLLAQPQRRPKLPLAGKKIVITGANSGIGLAIAHYLAPLGATLYLLCRRPAKGYEAANAILEKNPGASVYVLKFDASSMKGVQEFLKMWEGTGKVDVLYLNAGMGERPIVKDADGQPKKQMMSEDGFELMYQTNFLSGFVLVHELEKADALAPDARVVLTTSFAHYLGSVPSKFSLEKVSGKVEQGFHTNSRRKDMESAYYRQTKLMQAAFARALQQRWDKEARESANDAGADSQIQRKLVHSFHPGWVGTPFLDKIVSANQGVPTLLQDFLYWTVITFASYLSISPEEAACTAVYLGVAGKDGLEFKEGSSNREIADWNTQIAHLRDGGAYWDRAIRRISPVSAKTLRIPLEHVHSLR